MTEWEFKDIIRPLAGDPNADGFDDRLQGYHDRCRGTLIQLTQYLPNRAVSVLDVGCGMGGLGLLLADYYRGHGLKTIAVEPWAGPRLLLLDGGEEVVGTMQGHRPTGYESFSADNRPWNDARAAAHRFDEFGFVARATTPTRFPTEALDVVVSTRSWGHHYPVGTYAVQVRQWLSADGVVAIEIRNGTDGVERMREHFRQIDLFPAVGSTKCQMAVFKKK